jgi:hypothetical protein
MSASRQHDTWRELAARENDGLTVSLSWSKATGRTRVVVVDQMLKAELHVDVPPACALDAFYHPFAYAAGPGLEPSSAISEPSTPSRTERSAA